MGRLMDALDLMRNMFAGDVVAEKYLKTGSLLLDLACSGSAQGGLLAGKYYFIIGDSGAGKTWLLHSILAEASINPGFDEYRLIYDDVEGGALFDVERFFGKRLAKRLRGPLKEGGEWRASRTLEEFYFNADTAFNKGPCIYALDSMDALVPEGDQEHFDERKKASRTGSETSGSYGTAKAKTNSEMLRVVLSKCRQTGSILLIVGQTRDNLSRFSFAGGGKTRSGGRALKFYASLEMWLAVNKTLDRDIRGKKRQIGILAQIQIKKNRILGSQAKVVMPIYHTSGIDDIGACVDWMVEEKFWKKSGGKINAEELDINARRDDLIRYIEEHDMEADLSSVVEAAWQTLQDAAKVHRKPRY